MTPLLCNSSPISQNGRVAVLCPVAVLGTFPYHYGWLCEELTLISEMYADAMDVNHCNSAKNSSPEIPFLRLRWRQRSPRTLS